MRRGLPDSIHRSSALSATQSHESSPGSPTLDASSENMLKLAAEAAQLRLKVLALSAENERLKDTISFQLGNLLIRAKTWRGAIELPAGLLRLVRQSRQRRGRSSVRDPNLNPDTAARIQQLSLNVFDMRAEEIVATALTECRDPKLAMRVVADLSMSLQLVDFDKSIGENASLYVNNDFDVNLDHTETVVGFKYNF